MPSSFYMHYAKSGDPQQQRTLLSKHHQELLTLLQAVTGHVEVAIIHYKGHQKGNTDIIKRNNPANTATKRAVLPLVPLWARLFLHKSIPQQKPQSREKENGLSNESIS